MADLVDVYNSCTCVLVVSVSSTNCRTRDLSKGEIVAQYMLIKCLLTRSVASRISEQALGERNGSAATRRKKNGETVPVIGWGSVRVGGKKGRRLFHKKILP